MTRSLLLLWALPGRREELLRVLDQLELLVVIKEQPGLVRTEALVAEDSPTQVLVDSAWSSRAHYERWRESDERRQLLFALGRSLAREPEERSYRLVDAFG